MQLPFSLHTFDCAFQIWRGPKIRFSSVCRLLCFAVITIYLVCVTDSTSVCFWHICFLIQLRDKRPPRYVNLVYIFRAHGEGAPFRGSEWRVPAGTASSYSYHSACLASAPVVSPTQLSWYLGDTGSWEAAMRVGGTRSTHKTEQVMKTV